MIYRKEVHPKSTLKQMDESVGPNKTNHEIDKDLKIEGADEDNAKMPSNQKTIVSS